MKTNYYDARGQSHDSCNVTDKTAIDCVGGNISKDFAREIIIHIAKWAR